MSQTEIQKTLDQIKALHPRKYRELSSDQKRFIVMRVITNPTKKEINKALRELKEGV